MKILRIDQKTALIRFKAPAIGQGYLFMQKKAVFKTVTEMKE